MTNYEKPQVTVLGSVRELTRQDNIPDKCGGSGDAFKPLENILSNNYSTQCP